MYGDLFEGISFSLALPKENPNEVLKLMLAEIKNILHEDAYVQLNKAYQLCY